MNYKARSLFLLIGAIIGLVQCSPAQKSSNVTIGYSRLRISLPLFVAQEKGIFQKHGLKVDLQVYDTAQPMMQALVDGKLSVAGYTALPITYAGMIRSGKKLYFLTTMVEDQSHRISYLMRPRTGGAAEPVIKNISDLRGKKIGILPTIAYKAWLQAILKANGVAPDEVAIQQLDPTIEAQTLKNGGIDALFTGDPVATAAIQSDIAELIGEEVQCPKYIMNPFPFGSFNVAKDWADTHVEEVKRLVAALDEAVDFVNKNPREAKQCMKPYMPDQFKAHVDLYPDALYLSTRESNEATYAKIALMYVEMGIIEKAPDLTGLIVTSP